MEKFSKKSLQNIPSLKNLSDNWQKWGEEYKCYLDNGKKKGYGQDFSWREGIYDELKSQLKLRPDSDAMDEHCNFCDGYPFDEMSKETIEHFYPKNQFPLKSYDWDNLFNCCDKCQSNANRTSFEYTLQPTDADYNFDEYFYFDLESGDMKVLENLEIEDNHKFIKGEAFLERYGINKGKRSAARRHLYHDVKKFLKFPDNEDCRTRNDFKYRYVYDFTEKLQPTHSTNK